MEDVFCPREAVWRGLGPIPDSGLGLAPELGAFDAETAFTVDLPPTREPAGCRCGEVLKGLCRPEECPLFGETCTPENPVGACMVSSEGTCAAHYRYRNG
jgi:hydrogenase expression/formation protein HypD